LEGIEADRELLDELNQPAAVGAHAGVTRHLYEIYLRREDLRRAFPDLSGDDAAALVEWAHIYGRQEVPIPDFLLPPAPAEFRRFDLDALPTEIPPRPAVGVNVLGHLNGEMGIGEAGRLVIEALDAVDVPVLPMEGSIRSTCRHEIGFKALSPRVPGFPINLLCMNPWQLGWLAADVGNSFFAGRASIGFWWWEAKGELPVPWRPYLSLVDEVWVGSQYVAECLSELRMPLVPVVLPVHVPEPPALTRAQLGLPEGFLFMFLFDYHSTIQRKNPIAAIRAFEQAFGPGEGASLFIKSINASSKPPDHERVRAAAGSHPDIHVVDGYESADVKDALLAACDCYVSLHRAEGFGLTTAEAMYLGKPVIATGYSGNLEYMTPDNSHLVRHQQIKVGPWAAPYPMEGVWADPDVEHAASLMREVFDDQPAARRLGERAAADIRRTHSPEVAGRSMRRELERVMDGRGSTDRTVTPAQPGAAATLIERGPAPPRQSVLGAIGPLARRVALRLMKPYTVHQQLVNRQLAAELERAAAAARLGEQALERLRELEFDVAQVQAAQLRALPRRESRTAIPSTNGRPPAAR
jgi:glycosyltransferase involved in cell wall biosynthesis